MKDRRARERAAPRRPYEKPRLRRFALAPDEVLVEPCKTLGGASNVPFTGNLCGTGGCPTIGS